jgi:lambda repressor-like predicted transcriptional regulator
MRLLDLQDRLRAHIRARIERREWTGVSLSRQASLQQGHLSNFLNARRGLSLESMDRLLDALEIGVLDLVDVDEIERRMPRPPAGGGLESVAIVSVEHAARLPRFTPQQVGGTVSFRKAFLRRLRPYDVCHRGDWMRFVSVKLDRDTVRAMFARSATGATLLVDRHYTSLDPYRRQRPNLYAVRLRSRCAVGYVSLVGDHLVLRPRNPELPVELARINRTRSYSDYVVGRVCHVALEV